MKSAASRLAIAMHRGAPAREVHAALQFAGVGQQQDVGLRGGGGVGEQPTDQFGADACRIAEHGDDAGFALVHGGGGTVDARQRLHAATATYHARALRSTVLLLMARVAPRVRAPAMFAARVQKAKGARRTTTSPDRLQAESPQAITGRASGQQDHRHCGFRRLKSRALAREPRAAAADCGSRSRLCRVAAKSWIGIALQSRGSRLRSSCSVAWVDRFDIDRAGTCRRLSDTSSAWRLDLAGHLGLMWVIVAPPCVPGRAQAHDGRSAGPRPVPGS